MDRYEDENIYLCPMTDEDTEDIIRWRNSDAVRTKFIYQAPFTRQSHEKWVETMVRTGKVVQMIICEKNGDKKIGSVYIRDIDAVHHKGEYGIFIGEAEARGKGYGTAAALLMKQYAFSELHLHRLFLRVFADNAQAIASYEKAGFVREAYLKDDVCIDGQFRDIVLMAALAGPITEENKGSL
ncbi:MAG: GNAT family N-acetyltransferase [Lachnospiraceae bacterium]|nr:GNAT family N-acetyltransferase [Lachnospiraceae bacterium]